jgi:hypothetical protein
VDVGDAPVVADDGDALGGALPARAVGDRRAIGGPRRTAQQQEEEREDLRHVRADAHGIPAPAGVPAGPFASGVRCLTKHLAAWQQRGRKQRSDNRKRTDPQATDASADPFLWILAAGAPTTLLTKLKLDRAPDWPAGVYLFGDDVLRVGIVVASELPRGNATLLVRLMAAGPLLAPAVHELAALPPHAYERAVAEPVLLQLQHVLGQAPSRTPDEQEFITAVLKSWEEGRAEARAEGRVEGRADALLIVLDARDIAVPDAARERILAEKDPDRVTRWLEKATVAASLDDVLDGPS